MWLLLDLIIQLILYWKKSLGSFFSGLESWRATKFYMGSCRGSESFEEG